MRKLFAPLLLVPLAMSAACTAGSEARRTVASEVGAVQGAAAVSTLTAAELAPLVDAGSVMLIDVRTPEEFAQGNLPGAINIPLDRFDPLQVPDANGREVVLYCRSDRRSGLAAERWAETIGEPIRHLDGGILAWEAAGEAVETAPTQSD